MDREQALRAKAKAEAELAAAYERAAQICESFVVPSHQAGGDAIAAANYAFKCCAGAIRAASKGGGK